MKKKAEVIFYGICGLLILWFIVSVIEINMHSLTDQVYSNWNLIELLF
jgi:hypothetical protein